MRTCSHDRPMDVWYVIRVRGVLGDRLLGAFPGLDARRDGGDTLLVGGLPDQAALHGVLAQIEALGLELLEVRRNKVRARAAEDPLAVALSAGSDDDTSSR
jgi:hypothetical protein